MLIDANSQSGSGSSGDGNERDGSERVDASEGTEVTDVTSAAGDDVDAPAEIDVASDDEDKIIAPPEPLAVKEFHTFEEMNLHPKLMEAIAAVGWKAPTPVQGLCLPHTLTGRELAGFAQTGTGKTGVFLITVSDRLLKHPELRSKSENGISYPASLVLVPTRELAMQIHGDGEEFLGRVGIRSLAVFGGVDYEKQARTLQEGQVDVIIATPGRLKDFVQKKIVALDKVSLFVCDEVDRMFDMGFIEDVEYFLEKISETTQKLLFSATTNPETKELAFEYLNHPEYISVNPETITPDSIEQHSVIVESKNKLKVMLGMLKDHNPDCSIIFTNTKLTAEWLHFKLEGNGIDCDLITGDLPQRKRINLINRIKEGKLKALIATDVASRGLHISRVTHVYNFDLPDEPANYVHRIGRTARAGAKGSSYCMVCEDYGENLAPIKDMLGPLIPLKSEWFPESYLSIIDKAGNPFGRKAAEQDSQGAEGGGYGREQGRSNSGPRRPESRPSYGAGEGGRGQQGQGPQGGRGRDDGPRGAHQSGPRGGSQGGPRGSAQGGGNQGRGNQPTPGRGQQGQGGKSRLPQPRSDHQSRLPVPRKTSTPWSTLVDMFRKITGLFFGKPKQKK